MSYRNSADTHNYGEQERAESVAEFSNLRSEYNRTNGIENSAHSNTHHAQHLSEVINFFLNKFK